MVTAQRSIKTSLPQRRNCHCQKEWRHIVMFLSFIPQKKRKTTSTDSYLCQHPSRLALRFTLQATKNSILSALIQRVKQQIYKVRTTKRHCLWVVSSLLHVYMNTLTRKFLCESAWKSCSNAWQSSLRSKPFPITGSQAHLQRYWDVWKTNTTDSLYFFAVILLRIAGRKWHQCGQKKIVLVVSIN